VPLISIFEGEKRKEISFFSVGCEPQELEERIRKTEQKIRNTLDELYGMRVLFAKISEELDCLKWKIIGRENKNNLRKGKLRMLLNQMSRAKKLGAVISDPDWARIRQLFPEGL
jgi:hypothetical protein